MPAARYFALSDDEMVRLGGTQVPAESVEITGPSVSRLSPLPGTSTTTTTCVVLQQARRLLEHG
jgi:hypothetical protein